MDSVTFMSFSLHAHAVHNQERVILNSSDWGDVSTPLRGESWAVLRLESLHPYVTTRASIFHAIVYNFSWNPSIVVHVYRRKTSTPPTTGNRVWRAHTGNALTWTQNLKYVSWRITIRSYVLWITGLRKPSWVISNKRGCKGVVRYQRVKSMICSIGIGYDS